MDQVIQNWFKIIGDLRVAQLWCFKPAMVSEKEADVQLLGHLWECSAESRRGRERRNLRHTIHEHAYRPWIHAHLKPPCKYGTTTSNAWPALQFGEATEQRKLFFWEQSKVVRALQDVVQDGQKVAQIVWHLGTARILPFPWWIVQFVIANWIWTQLHGRHCENLWSHRQKGFPLVPSRNFSINPYGMLFHLVDAFYKAPTAV